MTCFRDLEGGPALDGASEECALGEWYTAVREKPLSNFDDDDLCRAVRQRLFLEHLIEPILLRLQGDILAGAVFEGELVCALATIPAGQLEMIPKGQRELLVAIVKAGIHRLGEDGAADVRVLLEQLDTLE